MIGEEDGTNLLLKITVVDVGNGKVKLGFEADDDVSVFREEVWNRMCVEGEVGRPGSPPLRAG